MDIKQKYFSEGKTSGDIIAKIISDIVATRLTGEELNSVINEMEARNMFENRESFVKVDRSKWTPEYLNKLSFDINKISRDYLLYMAEVATTIRERDSIHEQAVRTFKLRVIGIGASIVIIIFLIIRACTD
ncbi:hypothetical protein [Treponema sp.]|uniref:hypothetical protein n=1 Tax=Treponema sp. TaxID=166 RepID=UPI003FD8957B